MGHCLCGCMCVCVCGENGNTLMKQMESHGKSPMEGKHRLSDEVSISTYIIMLSSSHAPVR